MRKRSATTLMALGLSAAIGLAPAAVTAAPIAVQAASQAAPQADANIILAQGSRKGFRRDGDRAYYHGHRGYRHKRPGYRRYNDFWFPLAAFGLGAAIGSSVTRSSNGSAHVDWCYDHYRSYRAYDNTYQPYNGPRRQCNSPYG